MGFAFGGSEGGSQCYCGHEITAASKLAPGLCTTPCEGQPSEMCGGGCAIDVYQLSCGSDWGYAFTLALGDLFSVCGGPRGQKWTHFTAMYSQRRPLHLRVPIFTTHWTHVETSAGTWNHYVQFGEQHF